MLVRGARRLQAGVFMVGGCQTDHPVSIQVERFLALDKRTLELFLTWRQICVFCNL